jgi:hypothetical protein
LLNISESDIDIDNTLEAKTFNCDGNVVYLLYPARTIDHLVKRCTKYLKAIAPKAEISIHLICLLSLQFINLYNPLVAECYNA